MIFINKNDPIQIRIDEEYGHRWECVYTNGIIDLPKEVGIANNLTKMETTKGSIGKVIVETKQIDDFYEELCLINGIGVKTAKDIIKIFPEREGLKQTIKTNEPLPFRDDVEQKLKTKYGK